MKIFDKNKHCFVIAEISANHNQNLKRAIAMIRKAKECGADAVKFQAYTPDILTLDSDKPYFRIRHPRWGNQTLYKLYSKAYTPWKWFKRLKKTADDAGILFFSTAFDKTSVDFLEDIGVPFHKVASFELVDIPLIEYMAGTGKPIIMSTGMAELAEIRDAVNAARRTGSADIALLKCVSSYPAKPEEMNLRTIEHLKKVFKCPVGVSDHTLGAGVSVAAVSIGAQIIEKHFTLSRKIKTPDSFFSSEPYELKALVDSVRTAEKALGTVHYGLTGDEKKSLIFRRSLFVVKDMHRGERFSESNVRSIRPANGLKPKYLKTVLGKRATRDIARGTPLTRKLISR